MERMPIRNAHKGMTLVEVLIGTMIFFIAVLTIFQAMPVLDRNSREQRQRTLASLSARAQIEELKAQAASLTPGQHPFLPLEGTLARLAVTDVKQEDRLTVISVTVVWGDMEGQQIVLTTCVRKP